MDSFQDSPDSKSADLDTGPESELTRGLDHGGPECMDPSNMVRHALYYQETVDLCVS